jgi:hypothetical protein
MTQQLLLGDTGPPPALAISSTPIQTIEDRSGCDISLSEDGEDNV